MAPHRRAGGDSHAVPIGRTTVWVLALVALACSESPNGPAQTTTPTNTNTTVTVQLASPIGERIATGWTTQLTATVRDQDGNAVTDASITWKSQNERVAIVSSTGVLTGVASGTATITAAVGETTSGLGMTVVDVDVEVIQRSFADPFIDEIITPLDAALAATIEGHLAGCTTAAVEGNLGAIDACAVDLQSTMGLHPGGETGMLLAVLNVFVERVRQFLQP